MPPVAFDPFRDGRLQDAHRGVYLRVRLACHADGLSQREAASRFGIARETVKKMLRHSEPPGYRRRQPPKRQKLVPFTEIIDRILEEDRTVRAGPRRFDRGVPAEVGFGGRGKGDRPGHREHDHRIHR